MKKISFIIAVSAAVALSACTSESVIEDAAQDSKVINFTSVVNKHSRATTDLTTANLNHFAVFGYYTLPKDSQTASTIFYNEIVSTTNGVEWTYDGEKRYWIPEAKYYFFAYNCGNVAKLGTGYGTFDMNTDDKMDPEKRVLVIENYKCDDTHQHDLIFASSTGDNYAGIEGSTSGNNPVAFNFKHLLSKVRVNFKSTFPTEYEVVISNVKIQDIRNYGSYSPISEGSGWYETKRGIANNEHPAISLVRTSTSIVDEKPVVTDLPIETTNTGKTENPGVTTDYAYVLPYDYSNDGVAGLSAEDVFIYFDLTVYNKGQEVFNKTGMHGKFTPIWTPGFAYTYNIEVNGEAANLNTIEFTLAGVDEWEDAPEENYTNGISIDK